MFCVCVYQDFFHTHQHGGTRVAFATEGKIISVNVVIFVQYEDEHVSMCLDVKPSCDTLAVADWTMRRGCETVFDLVY